MKGQSTGPAFTVVFVDYDNIYLSLKRKNEEAAKRFAKDAGLWLREIETGRLLTTTNGYGEPAQRRIVMSRCYGNPVPRRNNHDNSTDMNSFPFVRHHFLRAGFEAIDCPPLTAQLKNSADIRMVMDVRDLLNHDTFFDEFVILSGDADFTPVLHRLRAHARRTVIFANDHTAAPYTAIADGEVREIDLVSLLLDGRLGGEAESNRSERMPAARTSADLAVYAKEIVAEVVDAVRMAGQPVPLEALADRAVRALGHEKTVASSWGGSGTFRELLLKNLPRDVRMNEEPPYFIYDASRQIAVESENRDLPHIEVAHEPVIEQRPAARPQPAAPLPPSYAAPAARRAPTPPQPAAPPIPLQSAPFAPPAAPSVAQRPMAPTPATQAALQPALQAMPARIQDPAPARVSAPAQRPQVATRPQTKDESAAAIQRTVARIYEACQAPPFSPPEYRMLFDEIAAEIAQNGLTGSQTIVNIAERAQAHGIETRRDDIKFVLEVVSEADPWFEQGVSAALFSSRFRNFVVTRCRSQGLTLSADELDLIDAWFMSPAQSPRREQAPSYAANPAPPAAPMQRAPAPAYPPAQRTAAPAYVAAQPLQPASDNSSNERWWSLDSARDTSAAERGTGDLQNHDPRDLPRFIAGR